MEVLIDGTWMPAYTPQPNALTAGTNGWPITEFDESGQDSHFDVVPGSIHRYEAISRYIGINLKLVTMVAPAVMERINAGMAKSQTRERQVLEEWGGVEGYHRMARRKRGIFEAEEVFVTERAGGRRANIVIEEQE